MKLADFPNVQALSPVEKLLLVDEIWSSLAGDLSKADVTEEEKRLLDERWIAFERDPASALTLDELKARIDNARK